MPDYMSRNWLTAIGSSSLSHCIHWSRRQRMVHRRPSDRVLSKAKVINAWQVQPAVEVIAVKGSFQRQFYITSNDLRWFYLKTDTVVIVWSHWKWCHPEHKPYGPNMVLRIHLKIGQNTEFSSEHTTFTFSVDRSILGLCSLMLCEWSIFQNEVFEKSHVALENKVSFVFPSLTMLPCCPTKWNEIRCKSDIFVTTFIKCSHLPTAYPYKHNESAKH